MNETSHTTPKEYAELLWINFVVGIKSFFEYLNNVYLYYSNFNFAKCDVSLVLMYLFHNPFSISKRFLMAKGEENIYAYGETPLKTMERIVKECNITAADTFYELGCGRGRLCFWLSCFVKCKVVGVEFVPDFIDRAKLIQKKLEMTGIEFRNEDITTTDYSGVTVVYLYGTGFNQNLLKTLAKRFEGLPVGTKFITVSYPLTDYTSATCFEVMKRFPCQFTWGEADVFLQIKK